MITTIDDALEFYAAREQEFSSFGASVLKRRAGSLSDLAGVVSELGLSQDYADCVENLSLENVSLGFFELSPGDSVDICKSLRVLNGHQRNTMLPEELLHVASFEADIVGVKRGEAYHDKKTVYWVDITTSPKIRSIPIAQSFNDFIVMASALDQAVLENSYSPSAVVTDLAVRKLPPGYDETWRSIADMVT